jgi:Lipoxygenase
MPVAIQLDASGDRCVYKSTRGRIYTPAEEHPLDWTFAKICVQTADALHHEMSTHLARCHFAIEPIAVATRRQLDTEHPLALLLNTHMRFHIANDAVARYTLSTLSPLVHSQSSPSLLTAVQPRATVRASEALSASCRSACALVGSLLCACL